MEVSGVVQVFLLALLTAVATGVGALPFLFVKDLTPGWLGAFNALASGLMLSAKDAGSFTAHWASDNEPSRQLGE